MDKQRQARNKFNLTVEDVRRKLIAMNPSNADGSEPRKNNRKEFLAAYGGLADQLISGSTVYLKDLAEIADDELAMDDVWVYEDLCRHVFGVLLSGRNQKDETDRAVAYFVEALMKCGSARMHAISATSAWLKPEMRMGISSVRACHQKYRKVEKKIFSLDKEKFICSEGWYILDNFLSKRKEKLFPNNVVSKTKHAYKNLLALHASVKKEQRLTRKPFSPVIRDNDNT